MGNTLSIKDWLRGKLGITIPNETLDTILWDNKICCDIEMISVDAKCADLCLADLYWWASSLPSTKNKVEDSDGQWKHIDGGQIISESDKSWFKSEANRLYAKWGLPTKNVATVKLINL